MKIKSKIMKQNLQKIKQICGLVNQRVKFGQTEFSKKWNYQIQI